MADLPVTFAASVAALALLAGGAELLVRGASALALRVGISALGVGLTVVAFGTSAPELVVSLSAALRDAGDIAVGNVVGSNICNIALILGLAALFKPTAVHAKVLRLDAPLMVGVSFLAVGMLGTGGVVSRIDGALLVGALVGYVAATLVQARRETLEVRKEFAEGIHPVRGRLAVSILLVVAGLAGLMAGGNLLVNSAVTLATAFGVSQAVIGLTIVAVGTSLPELATSLVAAIRGQGDIAVGNVVGSNVFNLLGILGISALARPLPQGDIAWTDLGVMVFLAIVLLPIARTGSIISRLEGLFLIAFYAAYLAWLAAAQ